MMTESLDDLIRALVTTDPPRWEDAARAVDGLKCAASVRESLTGSISQRAPLEEIWPILDALAAPPTHTGAAIDWTPPPIGEEMIREFFSEVDGFLVDLGPLLVDASDDTPDLLDEIHRRLHTIKGNSGMVGLTPLMRVVHVMEDLVKGIQGGDPPMDDAARAILLEGIGVATEITRVAREGSRDLVAWEEYRERWRSGAAGEGGAPSDASCQAGGGGHDPHTARRLRTTRQPGEPRR